jgi:hypothetical protein
MPSNVVELRLTSGTRGDGAPAADAAEGAARLLDGRRQGQGGQSMSLHEAGKNCLECSTQNNPA